MPLPGLYAAPKRIPFDPGWIAPTGNDGYLTYRVPLAVNDVLDTSLLLSVGTYRSRPDRHVTFELQIREIDDARLIRIERIDWRDMKGGHSNSRNRCPAPYGGRRVPATHVHSFSLNWVEAERRMKRGKLPCAEPLIPEPQSFEELRVEAGRRFNINNIDVVPRPPWEYDLFA